MRALVGHRGCFYTGALRSMGWELLSAMVEHAPYPMLAVNDGGAIILANQGATAVFGYGLEELLALDLDALVPPRLRGAHRAAVGAFLATLGSRTMGVGRELVAVRADGAEIPVEIALHPVSVDDALVVLTTVVDISVRVAAARSLGDSEQRYRLLTEQLPDIVFRVALHPAHHIDFVNPAFHEVTGYTPEEAYAWGPDWSELVHPDDRPAVWAALANATAAQLTVRVRTRGGAERIVDAHFAPVCDEQGQPAFLQGVARDMTDLLAAEASLESVQAQLTHAQKMEALGRLAGGVAHDFNNLLTVILSFAGFAAQAVTAGQAHEAREHIAEVLGASRRAESLTRQLLAFARKQAVVPKVVDVVAHLDGMRRLLMRLLGEDIELATRFAEGLWPVYVDPGALEQIVVNLAVNARDAMPHGGTLSIGARNTPTPNGDFVAITVTDTGSGMDEATLEHAFDPFFTTKEPGAGTGLGLSTCRGIAERAGGRIEVSSAPGRGTTFEILLPRAERAESEKTRAADASALCGSETVLVVEDESRVRQAVVCSLREYGYTVLEAASGADALDLCDRVGAIDLLVTDVVMPRMNGIELAKRLRVTRSSLPVLFITGYTAATTRHYAALHEDAIVLAKPFTPVELASNVRRVLTRG